MPIDSSVILGIRPAQVQLNDPLETYAKGMQLKALMGQNQMQDLAIADDAAQRQAYAESGGDVTKIRDLLASRGQYKAVQQLDKFILENQAKRAEIDKNTAQGRAANANALDKSLQIHREQLANVDNPQAAAEWVKAGYADPVLAPILGRGGSVQDAIARIPQDPAAFADWHKKNSLGIQKFTELNKPHVTTRDIGGEVQTVSTPGLGGAPTVLSSTPKTQSPDSMAADARVRAEGQANRANHRLIAGVDENGKPLNSLPEGNIDLTKVSPVDMEAAYRYFSDGTLPPNMGRGQQGMAESRRIRSIAAQIGQSLGISPEDARANQLAFKGSGQAITQLVKREAQIGANVRNFDFNADQVLQLSQKVDRTGVPVVNAWLNAGKRSVQGNPELSAFDVAVKTTVNEFAQIVSGTTAGATTEGEKQKAEKLLNAAQTPAQVTAIINQMRIESQNRMKSFADQKRETLTSMRANGKPLPANPVAAAKADQQAGRPAVPPAPMTNNKGWTLHVDAKGNKAYVSPDGKQYEEVK